MPRLLALLFCCFITSVSAQGFRISPPSMTINPAQRVSTQTQFTNDGALAQQFTVKVVSWTMKDGQDVYAPSRDLIVNPSAFEVKPGDTQVIRIGLLKKPGAAELAYRVILTQTPRADAPTTTEKVQGVTLNLKQAVSFGLAVYVTSANATPKMTYRVTREANDLLLETANAGNRHQLYNVPTFKAADRSLTLPSYAVLSGATYTVRLKDWGSLSGSLALSFDDVNGDTQNETLALP